MTEATAKLSTQMENLTSLLLTTLDEGIFFSTLCKYLSENIQSDRVLVYKVCEDSSALLMSRNGQQVNEEVILEKGASVTGHVIKTKKAYFSNSVARDPLFNKELNIGTHAELAVPVTVDGVVIATIHIQSLTEEKQFNRDNITEVLEILNSINKPLKNMKMYLSAMFLSQSLMKQVQLKEKELEQTRKGTIVSDTYKIQDEEIVGKSNSMRNLLALTDKVANSNVCALVRGETGTGKERVARRVHCRSERNQGGFLSVDCSVHSEEQLEKELFGEEITDFTQGNRIRKGVLEKADNGTVFLNNVETLTVGLQLKILKYITEGTAFRVNGQIPYRTNARILSATTKDITELVAEGRFREDLYFSLATLTLDVPALRERNEDIELLASHFLNANRRGNDEKALSPGAVSRLLEYNWPGNVRELQSIMERAYILADGMIIEKDHLADSVAKVEIEQDTQEVVSTAFTEMTLNDLEKSHICRTLDHLGGNKTKTAKTLGITVKTLYNKLHSYGMIAPKEA
jgi:Nif-specific regulatory protein